MNKNSAHLDFKTYSKKILLNMFPVGNKYGWKRCYVISGGVSEDRANFVRF